MFEPKPSIEYELDGLQCCLDHLWDFLGDELKIIKLLVFCTLLASAALGLLILGSL